MCRFPPGFEQHREPLPQVEHQEGQCVGTDGEGAIITQVVPFPFDASLPLVKEYQEALKAHNPDAEPGFVSLEGYMVGKLTAEALKKTGADVTREAFIDSFAKTGTFDLGGVALTYGANDNQGMDQVFLTKITADGSFESLENLK